MSGKVNKPRTRKQLSKADLKAYESRKAAERRRAATASPNPMAPTEPAEIPVEHSFAISRDEEYGVIKSDLIRLLIVVAVLFVALLVLTVMLR